MIKTNKKGTIEFLMLFFSMLISIGTLIVLTFMYMPDSTFIGSTQVIMLTAYEHSEHKANYLDMALDVSAKQVAPEVIKRTGFIFQIFEDEIPNYPCGNLIHPILNSDECFPDYAQTHATLAAREMNLYARDKNIREQITITPQRNQRELKLKATTTQPLQTQIFSDRNAYQIRTQTIQVNQQGYTLWPTLPSRTRNTNIDTIIMHYTVTRNVDTTYNVLSDAGLSYHFVIDKNGDIHQFVPESRVAYHAGCGDPPRQNCVQGYNSRSIGISLVGCGYDNELCRVEECYVVDEHERCFAEFPQVQIDATIRLISEISQRNNLEINTNTVIGHSDVDQSKADPGPAFPMETVIQQARERASS